MKQWNKRKQDGVVLLTCLVFLLILLAMLRFVLGSAKLEEEKAGIDLEIHSAREAAQSALSYAEYFILRQGQLYCKESKDCNAAGEANILFNASQADLENFKKSAPRENGKMAVKSVSEVLNKGLYTGEYIEKNAANCQPLWICVDWGSAASTVKRSAKARGASGAVPLKSMVCEECQVLANTAQPQFIIERYTDKELNNRGLGSLVANAKESVVFRITAVGFGRGSGKNVTNVMLQSTYVIPK